MKRLWWAALLFACDDGGGADAARGLDAAADAVVVADRGVDAEPEDAAPGDGAPGDAAAPDAAPYPARPRPPAAAGLTAPRGWLFARGLIHMHSVHSHDACDGEPKPEGVPDAVCLERLRAALCHNRFEFLLLTDHPDSFSDIPFVESLLSAPGDELIEGPHGPMANRIACPDGHRVLLAPGSEGDLTPVMFQRKPEHRFLRMATPEGVAALREAGALVFQAHIERFTAEALRPLALDGLEIYNLHANLDPGGELRQLAEVLPGLIRWINLGAAGPHPDLAFLAVFRENHLALAAWDGLLPTSRITGFAGSDIHENLPPLVRPPDGERIDSYRRLGSWFSNVALVEAPTYDALRAAVAGGRMFVIFDLWGPPDGFDFHGVSGGEVLEMGAEQAFSPGTMLRARPPQLPAGASVELVLRRVTAEGSEVVARGDGPLAYEAPGAGAYRLEVHITPGHLRAALGDLADEHLRSVVWIYTNPIYLR